MGPLIEDPDDRDRITILNTCGQIEFTSNGHDRLRPFFDDDSSCQGPTRSHSDLYLVLLRKFDEILDLTRPASLAIFDVSRDLDLAVKILDTVWKKDQ